MHSPTHTQNSSRLKRVVIDAAIVIGLAIALLVLAEGFLAVFLPQNLSGERIAGKTFSEPDDVLGMRYVPGAKWRFHHPEYTVEYAINQDGFRDEKAHPVPKPADTVRVLLVGDSFTFGHGVDYEQSWPVIVETHLAELGYSHIDLVKAGRQGLDTRSEFILLQRLLEKYQYDIVVVGFLINDLYTNTLDGLEEPEALASLNEGEQSASAIQREAADSWAKTAKRMFIHNDRSWTFHLLTLARRMTIASSALYCKLYFASGHGKFLTLPLSPDVQRKHAITTRLFEKMADYSQAVGKKLIVLSIPQQAQTLCFEKSKNLTNINIAFYDEFFSDFAARHGFTWVAALDSLNDSQHSEGELFYRLDGHLTPYGNQLLANVFLEKIVPLISSMKH